MAWSRGMMTKQRFTIRYRQRTNSGTAAVLVEDPAGQLHIFTKVGLLPYLRRGPSAERRTETLRNLGWVPVPPVEPYTLDGLQRLFEAGTPTQTTSPVPPIPTRLRPRIVG